MTTNRTSTPRTAVARLTGRLSQCTACGEVFGGEQGFDLHRVWRDGQRTCRDPAEVGLVILRRKNGTRWGRPMKRGVVDRLKEAA